MVSRSIVVWHEFSRKCSNGLSNGSECAYMGGDHVMVRVDGQHPGRCQRQSQARERSTTRGMANNPNDDMLDWGTRSIPRHNPLRGWGALPDHTRGNAADGVTPGFMAESPWDSRRESWLGQWETRSTKVARHHTRFPNATNVVGATSHPPFVASCLRVKHPTILSHETGSLA